MLLRTSQCLLYLYSILKNTNLSSSMKEKTFLYVSPVDVVVTDNTKSMQVYCGYENDGRVHGVSCVIKFVSLYGRIMKIYYTGFNNSKLFCNEEDEMVEPVIDKFTIVPFQGISDLEIGWNYMILWREKELFVSGTITVNNSTDADNVSALLKLPNEIPECKQAIAGKEAITILSTTNEIWQYKIFEKTWKKVFNFIHADDDNLDEEYPIKVFQGGCTVALTNFGRVYNIPTLVDIPKRVKFVDVACGFDHTIMLAENGDVYSMGMGTRGQLGHGDLEDCDNPKIIEALAGLKVIRIAANGWHSALVTDQGDLYTWGWNTNGELGIPDEDTKIFAAPKVVDFTDENGKTFDATVKNVQCGNMFTICMLDDNSLWGCGSNKYGQLGMPRETLPNSKAFVKLNIGVEGKSVKDFKCREWSSIIISD